jgi:DNA-directed RNA polymerase
MQQSKESKHLRKEIWRILDRANLEGPFLGQWRQQSREVDIDAEELEALADKTESDKIKAEEDKQLLHKFVDLSTLLPPLPKKGSFEVRSIKDSPYFFS